MPAPRELHRGATRLLSVAMVLIGVAVLIATVAHGGGILSRGLLLGLLFVAAGAGRLYISRPGRGA